MEATRESFKNKVFLMQHNWPILHRLTQKIVKGNNVHSLPSAFNKTDLPVVLLPYEYQYPVPNGISTLQSTVLSIIGGITATNCLFQGK